MGLTKLREKEYTEENKKVIETSLGHKVVWEDSKTYEDEKHAENAVINMSIYSNMDYVAVPYFRPIDETGNIVKMDKKLAKLNKRVNAVLDEQYYTPYTVKSKYITCKRCGSRLAVKHLFRNHCPLCGNDLRPKFLQNKIEELVKTRNEVEKALKEVKKNVKQEKAWLILYE